MANVWVLNTKTNTIVFIVQKLDNVTMKTFVNWLSLSIVSLAFSHLANAAPCKPNDCTKEKCTTWAILASCQASCGADSCKGAQAAPTLSVNDANELGQYEKNVLMNQIFKKRPSVQRFFDGNCATPGHSCPQASNTSKDDIFFAIGEMAKGCKSIIDKLAKVSPSNPKLEELRTLVATFMTESGKAIKSSDAFAAGAPISKGLKTFEPLTLYIKNCYNQGEAAIFLAKSPTLPKK